MKYTVVWTPIAERGLASIWLVADDRTAVAAAANSLDSMCVGMLTSVANRGVAVYEYCSLRRWGSTSKSSRPTVSFTS
jgi:hypothetical protein